MIGQCRQCGTPFGEGAEFCPQCGSALVRAKPETPALSKGKAAIKKWVIVAIPLIVLGLGLAAYLRIVLRQYHPVIANQPAIVIPIDYGVAQKIPSTPVDVTMDQGFIVLPLRAVTEHKLVRFFDPEHIQQFPMIAYITPEGKVVTAMSISENCRSTDFYLEGHNIHCASCPSYWNMSSLEAYACCQKFYPDPIPSTLLNDQIRIEAKVVRSWKSRI